MKGILLIQLGSPRSPAIADVRRFLCELLMDPRILDLPWPLRKALVEAVLMNGLKVNDEPFVPAPPKAKAAKEEAAPAKPAKGEKADKSAKPAKKEAK